MTDDKEANYKEAIECILKIGDDVSEDPYAYAVYQCGLLLAKEGRFSDGWLLIQVAAVVKEGQSTAVCRDLSSWFGKEISRLTN